MKNKKKLKIALVILCTVILLSAFAPLLAPHDPNQMNIKNQLAPISRNHLLGTDHLGRDVLSRTLYGGRTSMIVALIAVFLSMTLGLIIGSLAGFYGGVTDELLTGCILIFQGIPQTSFMIAVAGILGFGVKPLIIGLLLTSWAGFSKIIRQEVRRLREEPFIEAMISLGANHRTLLLRHILPNIFPDIIVIFTMRIGRSLLAIAGLTYLGLGVTPPTADWSVMIADARMYCRLAPRLLLIPGLCISLLVYAINQIGDVLRDFFDIRSQEVII